MILLVVFGGLIFVLGCFYLVNSWQQYHRSCYPLVLVSLAVTGDGPQSTCLIGIKTAAPRLARRARAEKFVVGHQ